METAQSAWLSVVFVVLFVSPVRALFCPTGQFVLNHQCVDCHPTCGECSGHEPFECTECGLDQDGVTRFLHRNRCKVHCPRGFYPDPLTYACELCTPNCDACLSVASCETCKENYSLQNGACYFRQCHEGQVEDPDTGECFDCQSGCKTCAAGDPESCNSCSEGYFLYRHQCYRHCPQKTYQDDGRRMCFLCPLSCFDCKNDTYCSSCQVGYFLYDSICELKCPDGTFQNSNSWRCEPCHSSCQSCHGPSMHECDLCSDGKQPANGLCKIITCSLGWYFNIHDGTCYVCDESCHSCFGPTAMDCFSCNSESVTPARPKMRDTSGVLCKDLVGENEYKPLWGFHHLSVTGNTFLIIFGPDVSSSKYECSSFLQIDLCSPKIFKFIFSSMTTKCLLIRNCQRAFFLDEDNRCIEECPMGSFGNLYSQTCEKCAANCESCDASSDDCVRCKSDGHNLFLHNGRCIFNCPEGYFENTEGSCEACDNSCWSCDESPMKCLSCASGLYLENSKCIPNCSLRYYPDADGTCKRCVAHCNICADSRSCAECSYLYLLLNGTCRATCPDGYFEDLDHGKCIECYSSCATCSGISYDDCESCLYAYSKLYQGECLDECPTGTFYNHLMMECQECDKTCATCTGPEPTDCTKCQSGLNLDRDSCMCGVQGDAKCPPQTYLLSDLFTCKVCHDSCESCNGPSLSDCLTCTLPFQLYNNACETECPPGTYNTSEEADGVQLGYCSKCNPVCLTCNGGSAKDCTTCAAGYYKLLHLCILHCPSGYYKGNGRCEKCHPSCQLCYGAGREACLTCPNHTLQMDGVNHCVSQCPERFYQQKQICQQCHPSCKKCKDPTPEGCLSCDWGNEFKDGICFPRCEESYYFTEDEECKMCDPSCRHCTGPGPQNCIICQTNSAWDHIEKKCIKCCDPQIDQQDCCFCKSQTALCVRISEPAALGKTYMPTVTPGAPSLDFGRVLPVLASLLLFLLMAALIVHKARAKNKLCWRQSYDRLHGSSRVIPIYEHIEGEVVLRRGIDDGEDSPDECDVVYSSRDGTVFRKYCFKLNDDDDGDEDEHTSLNKAKC